MRWRGKAERDDEWLVPPERLVPSYIIAEWSVGTGDFTIRTQSWDTSPEMEQVQIAGLRAFAPAKKFA